MKTWIILLVWGAICGDLLGDSTNAVRPNILWLIAEDLGPHLSCCGTPEVWTPNLDRMASDGVRYTRFFNGNDGSKTPAIRAASPSRPTQ